MEDRIPFRLEYQDTSYWGYIFPRATANGGWPQFYRIVANNLWIGDMEYADGSWRIDRKQDQVLIDLIGEYIVLWYE